MTDMKKIITTNIIDQGTLSYQGAVNISLILARW